MRLNHRRRLNEKLQAIPINSSGLFQHLAKLFNFYICRFLLFGKDNLSGK